MYEDLSLAVENGQIGFARAGRDMRVMSRKGRLSLWLPAEGEPCCTSALLFGMEDDLLALQGKYNGNITLPGIHVTEMGEGLRANIVINWDVARSTYLFLTMVDHGAGEIEALLTAERRNKQIADERLLAETERANIQTRINAVSQERSRIARDLHDTFIQSMVAVLTQIRLVQKMMQSNSEMALRELRSAEGVAREGLDNAREALGEIRSRVHAAVTLGASIRNSLARMRTRLNINVSLTMDTAADDLGGEVAQGVARIFEEALRNIERHAQARSLDVRLSIVEQPGGHAANLLIEDDGIGFDPDIVPEGHFGLVGITEQVELLGGILKVESMPGHGARLEARIPIPRHGAG